MKSGINKKKVAVGVDIGGTNTVFGIIDREGKCLISNSISTKQHGEILDFIECLTREIKNMLSELNEDVEVQGVGIGAPMGNYFKGTIEQSAGLPWKGIINFIEIFKSYYNVPAFLTNDANLAALGEMVYGGAKHMKDFIVITLGTGLGSGFVVNGQVIYGHDGFAGELGHVFVNCAETGRECGCGRKGCLETHVSATGIKRTVYRLLADLLSDSELRDVSFNNLTAKMIYEAAKRGDKIALAAFEHTGKVLGMKLADAITHTSPEAIFLFGGLAMAGDFIFEPTRRHLEKNLLPIYKGKVNLLPSALTENANNAAILGASALVWNELNY